MSATPIADLLGIDTSKGVFDFEFRGNKFRCGTPPEGDRDTLLRDANSPGEYAEFWSWLGHGSEPDNLAEAAAMFLAPDAGYDDSADAILSEARAAIAAQGGAE